MKWALFGVALVAAIAAVIDFARRQPLPKRYVRPGFTVPDPAQRLFGHLFYTEEQSAAITAAGFAIQKGNVPSTTLPPDAMAQLREVHEIVAAVECAPDDAVCLRYRIGVLECLEEAGSLVGMRLRKIEEIPWPLYTAAMGVSVVTREVHYRTVAALIHFCQDLIQQREKHRPRRSSGTAPRP
jgi:hypothetical protein